MSVNTRVRTAYELEQKYDLQSIGALKTAVSQSKRDIVKVENEIGDFTQRVIGTEERLEDLQKQVDGNITTWFYKGVPTASNQPANEWTTDEDKIKHLGDLYYDQNTGYAYRWAYENNTYLWSKIVDADVTEALAVANAAQDTADSKRRVFVVQPTTPYDVGDLWFTGSTDSTGELKRCIRTRETGNFSSGDWIIATKYTDDTYAKSIEDELTNYKVEVNTTYTTKTNFDQLKNGYLMSIKSTLEPMLAEGNELFETQPTPPYHVGDVYVKDYYIYVCIKDRTTGAYNETDWKLNESYIGDTQLSVIDGKVSSSVSESKGYTDGQLNQTKTDLRSEIQQESGQLDLKIQSAEREIKTLGDDVSSIKEVVKEASGNPIDIEASNNILKSFIVEGRTEQDTYSGKNLVGVKETDSIQSGVTYSYNTNGTFNLSGTATSVCYFTKDMNLEDTKFVNGGTYTLSFNKQIPSGIVGKIEIKSATSWLREYAISNATGSKTYTIDLTNCAIIRTTIQVNNTSVTNVSDIGFQVEQGNTATSFEKYVGGTPSPNPNYPQEVRNVKGWNLLSNARLEKGNSGVTITKNEDGTITLNGTTTATEYLIFDINNASKGTYTISFLDGKIVPSYGGTLRYVVKNSTGSNLSDISVVNKSSSTETYSDIPTTFRYYIPRGNTFNNVKLYTQMIKGTQAKPYTPYGTIQTKVIGKNLCDLTKEVKTSVTTGITELTSNSFVATGTTSKRSQLDFIIRGLEKNTNYVFRFDAVATNTSATIGTDGYLVAEDGTRIRQSSMSGYKKEFAFNTGNYNNIEFVIYGSYALVDNITTFTNVQLTKGTQATPYEPYKESTYLIESKDGTPIELCKIGDIEDTYENGVITKRIGKVVLDGSEAYWTKSATSTSDKLVGALLINKLGLNIGGKYGTGTKWKCSHFIYGGLGVLNTFYTYNGNETDGYMFIGFTISTSIASDIATFKNWLSQNKPILYYVLAEPIEIETNLISVETFEGTNHISIDTDTKPNMEIEYYTKNVFNEIYTNKIEQETSLKLLDGSIKAEVKRASEKEADIEGSVELKINKDDLVSEFNAKANVITLTSDNFKLKANGDMECNNAKINGSELVLNDNGTYDDASMIIKRKVAIETDIFLTTDLSGQKVKVTMDRPTITGTGSSVLYRTDGSDYSAITATISSISNGYLLEIKAIQGLSPGVAEFEAILCSNRYYTNGKADVINEYVVTLPENFGKVYQKGASIFTDKVKLVLEEMGTTSYSSSGMSAKIYSTEKYSNKDLAKAYRYIHGEETLTEAEFEFLDVNKDNKINIQDLLLIQLNGGVNNFSKTQPGRMNIDTTTDKKNISFWDCDGNINSSIGADGVSVYTKGGMYGKDGYIDVGEAFTYNIVYKPGDNKDPIIGTWIDGKPIHRKVITLDESSSTGVTDIYDLGFFPSSVINIYGTYQDTYGYIFPLNTTNDISTGTFSCAYVVGNNIAFFHGRTVSKGYAIVEYTI